jgi:signal peptidase I
MAKKNPIEAFKNATKKTKIYFAIAALIYILFVIWLRSPLWLLGLLVIYDLYFTKWVKWAFWKKRYKPGEKHNALLDWLDAIIFALIVATIVRTFFIEAYVIPSSSMEKSMLVGDYLFVSKYTYGPKVPNTPLSVPLAHNRIGSSESYSKLIQLPYKRLAGLSKVKRNDVVVFNFPNGDTIVDGFTQEIIDYYDTKRQMGAQGFDNWLKLNNCKLIQRPVDKKDNYVKRCVAIPGDTLEIRHSQLFINSEPAQSFPGQEYSYTLMLKENLPTTVFTKLGLSNEDLQKGYANLPLTQKIYEQLKDFSAVVSIERNEHNDYNCFPFSKQYHWSIDNYGPLWVPAKNTTVQLDLDNLCLYERIIGVYENNTLEVRDGVIYINGEAATSYTFKMDYFFMMGDNRHGSYDSRMWGFVPEDHIVGKPLFVWFSSNKDKSFPANIRWNRIFSIIK